MLIKCVTLIIIQQVQFKIKGAVVLNGDVSSLFRVWEETSYRLECRQANPMCARQEFEGLRRRLVPKYQLSFDANVVPKPQKSLASGDLFFSEF